MKRVSIDIVNKKIEMLLQDFNLVEMMNNFIQQSYPCFLSKESVISLEHDFWYANLYSSNLDIYDINRQFRFGYVATFNSYVANPEIDYIMEFRFGFLGTGGGARGFSEQDFRMLCRVIAKRNQLADDLHLQIAIFLTLEKVATYYYADKWRKKYGHYFLEDMNLDECVSKYLSLDHLDLRNEFAIGEFTYYLIDSSKFQDGNFLSCFEIVSKAVAEEFSSREMVKFEAKLLTPQNKSRISINDIDLMNGYEFEKLIKLLFSKMNYSTSLTKVSGDQGIDLVAEKNGQKIGIQAKCYSGKVSNSAVQEVVAGIGYYGCDKGVVITNSFFTNAAIELAQANNVLLWDRTMLIQKLDDVINAENYE